MESGGTARYTLHPGYLMVVSDFGSARQAARSGSVDGLCGHFPVYIYIQRFRADINDAKRFACLCREPAAYACHRYHACLARWYAA